MEDLFANFKRKHDYLVCIDSDGCAMDTMDIKHFLCFGPCMISQWGLEKWEDELLKYWNEVNLYSMTRGTNRFKALALVLKEADSRYKPIEGIDEFAKWSETAPELSNDALKKMELDACICFRMALSWSEAVNTAIVQLPDENKKPYDGVQEGISAAHGLADVAIVSSANQQAVIEEWERCGLLTFTDIVLTQNAGSKAFCISKMIEYGYPKDHVLMIGDAPGDYQAAMKNEVCFYPILVRNEAASWKDFRETILQKFIADEYRGEQEDSCIEAFEQNLSK